MSPRRVSRALVGLAAAVAACVAAGCGFRLAGSEPLPAVVARPYLSFEDSYTDFARAFERHLQNAGAQIASSARESSALVAITHDEVRQRVLSVSARNIPTEFELTYSVTVAVQAEGRELMAPQVLSLTRDYSFDENRLLAKEHEQDVLRQQMARDLAVIAAHRLASLRSGATATTAEPAAR